MLDINKKKEALSRSYLNAICASSGIAFEIQGDDADSKDVILKMELSNPKFYSTIGVQLKATSKDIDKGEFLKYPLNKKNYDDLKTKSTMKSYLFVLLIHIKNEEDWIKQDSQELIIKACMYYFDVSKLEESENSDSVTITIPKENIVSVSNLISLLENERN